MINRTAVVLGHCASAARKCSVQFLLKLIAGIALCTQALNGAAEEPAKYSTSVGKAYPQNVYWGDTHLHTRNSADACSLGNMNLTPADAYRFARGQ